MKGFLKPRYTQSVNDLMVLWFEPSNRYAIVDNGLFFCLQTYFDTDTEKQCLTIYQKQFPFSTVQAKQLLRDVEQFLKDNNTPLAPEESAFKLLNVSPEREYITKYYNTGHLNFKVNYASESLITYIHPLISHVEVENNNATDEFQISEHQNKLLLLKNGICVKHCKTKEFHKLQGKFNMELINSLYQKTEHDWVGLFHASTISNNSESVMLIGQSGSGKSTFTTLLSYSGYALIADDTTPLLRKNLETYHFPGGISTKEGAFNILRTYIPNIDELENNHLRAYKGAIKYIPAPTPDKLHVPCKTLVLINYQKDTTTELKRINAKEALEVLIPDSWISPKPENAKAFLKWLTTLSFYKLTYSNNEDAILKFRSILPI